MALIVLGKSRCPLCGKPLAKGDEIVSFPAFLPQDHALARFSDAGFHRACWDVSPFREPVERLHQQFRAIWSGRPKGVRTSAEIDLWAREAFRNFPARLQTPPGVALDARVGSLARRLVDRPLRRRGLAGPSRQLRETTADPGVQGT